MTNLPASGSAARAGRAAQAESRRPGPQSGATELHSVATVRFDNLGAHATLQDSLEPAYQGTVMF